MQAMVSALAVAAAFGGLAGFVLATVMRRSTARVATPHVDLELPVRERHLAVALLSDEIAHELASPLTYLRDIVLHTEGLDATDRSIGEEEVARLESMVAQLRRTRRGEMSHALVALAPVVDRAVARARAELRRDVRVVVDVPTGLRVTANETALELLLLVLVRNAVAAASAGGNVLVRARAEAGGGRLEVEDDGAGMRDELRDVLFHPLTTLGPEGIGMGLPMALRLARDHAFRLSHHRENDRTVFRVRFQEPVSTR
jgi:signal transduction histidine kinase